MKIIISILILILAVGCRVPSQEDTVKVAANNKDVFILSALIQNHFRNTNGEIPDFKDLTLTDTAHILSGFEKIKTIYHGGHISVYYTLSKSRDNQKVKLSDQETHS